MVDAAFCLFGQMRTYERCFEFLETNVLDRIDPDVFIHTWEERGGTWKKGTDSKYGKYKWPRKAEELKQRTVSEEGLKRKYSATSVVVEEFDERYYSDLSGVSVPGPVKDHEGYAKGLLPMFYKMREVVELMKEEQQKRGKPYDVVLLARPDIAIFEPIPEAILKRQDCLWEFGSQKEYFVDDIMVASSPANIDYYTSIFDNLEDYWTNIPLDKQKRGAPIVVSPESLLFHHIERSNIQKCHSRSHNFEMDSEWYLIRIEHDPLFIMKNKVERILHILTLGDTGIRYDCGVFERGLVVLREEGLRSFLKKSKRWLKRNTHI